MSKPSQATSRKTPKPTLPRWFASSSQKRETSPSFHLSAALFRSSTTRTFGRSLRTAIGLYTRSPATRSPSPPSSMAVECLNWRSSLDDAARDDEIAAEWTFHDYILGVKTQVKTQFGDSSNEIQSVRLKKKSEYKSASKKAPTP